MFFGVKIKDNKYYTFQRTNNIIHISQACLGGKPDESKIYVKIVVDELEYSLCVLQKNVVESFKIDHIIAWGKNNKSFKLVISGGGPKAEVHITGYVEIEESEENEEIIFGEIRDSKVQELSLNEKEAPKRKSSKASVEIEVEKKEKVIHKEENKRKLSEPKEEIAEKKENKTIGKIKEEIPQQNDFNYGEESENDLFKDEGDEEIEKLLKKKRKLAGKIEALNNPQKLKEMENDEEKSNKFDNKNNKKQNSNKGKQFNNKNN